MKADIRVTVACEADGCPVHQEFVAPLVILSDPYSYVVNAPDLHARLASAGWRTMQVRNRYIWVCDRHLKASP